MTSTRYLMCYHTFSVSVAWFGGYLQRFTMRYRQIYKKKMYINIFKKKTMVTCGIPLQIVPQIMLN